MNHHPIVQSAKEICEVIGSFIYWAQSRLRRCSFRRKTFSLSDIAILAKCGRGLFKPTNYIEGKEYYIVVMHPIQKYWMDVCDAKMWYKDMMRQIRMLKYFER